MYGDNVGYQVGCPHTLDVVNDKGESWLAVDFEELKAAASKQAMLQKIRLIARGPCLADGPDASTYCIPEQIKLDIFVVDGQNAYRAAPKLICEGDCKEKERPGPLQYFIEMPTKKHAKRRYLIHLWHFENSKNSIVRGIVESFRFHGLEPLSANEKAEQARINKEAFAKFCKLRKPYFKTSDPVCGPIDK